MTGRQLENLKTLGILNNTLLNNTQVEEYILMEILKYFELNENKKTISKFAGDDKNSVLREIHVECIYQKKVKINMK